MNAYRFVKEERTQDLASKAGVYAIHNPDSISNKKNPMYKVGKANVFANRFTGQEHSSYGTAYPLGFQVDYLYVTPKNKNAKREKQVQASLDKNPKVKRFGRPITRGKKHKESEWFATKDQNNILNSMIEVWKQTGKETGDIYQCNMFRCSNITKNMKKDPRNLLKWEPDPIRKSGRKTKQLNSYIEN